MCLGQRGCHQDAKCADSFYATTDVAVDPSCTAIPGPAVCSSLAYVVSHAALSSLSDTFCQVSELEVESCAGVVIRDCPGKRDRLDRTCVQASACIRQAVSIPFFGCLGSVYGIHGLALRCALYLDNVDPLYPAGPNLSGTPISREFGVALCMGLWSLRVHSRAVMG